MIYAGACHGGQEAVCATYEQNAGRQLGLGGRLTLRRMVMFFKILDTTFRRMIEVMSVNRMSGVLFPSDFRWQM